MTQSQVTECFHRFDLKVRSLVEQQSQAGKLRALPLSPIQLAREAERFSEFDSLVTELFNPPSVEELKDEYDFIEDPEGLEALAEAESDRRLEFYSAVLADWLKRSGYYHAVLSGTDEAEDCYSAIKERVAAKHRNYTKLYLLDGCTFCRDQFAVAGIPVVRMSRTELEELGPSAAVCRDFLMSEWMDFDRFSQHWFLRVQEDVSTTYDYDNGLEPSSFILAPRRQDGTQEVAAGYVAPRKSVSPTIPKYLDALLILSLTSRNSSK